MTNKALITGVSSGIGHAIAKLLLSDGFEVYGTYNRNKSGAMKLKEGDAKITLYQVDFSQRTGTLRLIQELKELTFDVVINNAGIIEFEDWNSFTMETWDRIFEVNLNTPMLLLHSLRNNISKGGSVVNISSTDGMMGSFSSIAYSASKAALLNLTKSLTNNFADRQVRVNTVAPGWIGDGMGSPVINEAKWINPLNRTATYEEVAKVVKFLISSESSFINGETIVVDGGSSAVDYVLKKEKELV